MCSEVLVAKKSGRRTIAVVKRRMDRVEMRGGKGQALARRIGAFVPDVCAPFLPTTPSPIGNATFVQQLSLSQGQADMGATPIQIYLSHLQSSR